MSTSTNPPAIADFLTPPPEPMKLLRSWLASASADNVREPGALALASSSSSGHASNRIVQMLDVRNTGIVFASHTGSRKGRELAATSWASGVLYWREVGRQVIVTGPTHPLPETESDALWAARNVSTHPMSVASQQSEPLPDPDELRARADRLGRAGAALPRPNSWVGYLVETQSAEFWQSDPDRLHQRLLYEKTGSSWRASRLQP